jgi:hypothetical protein
MKAIFSEVPSISGVLLQPVHPAQGVMTLTVVFWRRTKREASQTTFSQLCAHWLQTE